MSVQSNEGTVKRLGACFGAGDLPGALACLSGDVTWELPAPPELPYGGHYSGHKGYATWYHRVKETLQFKKVTTADPVGQGNTVILLGSEVGIAKPTGQDYHYTWAQVYTFDDNGLISGMLQYFNPANILAALSRPRPLPAIPQGFGLPFYYSSLTNLEVLYLVDPAQPSAYLAGTGLRAAEFDGQACVSFNFQAYTGQFPTGSSFVQEIELNIVAYPEALGSRAAALPFDEFLLGNDQTKLLGNHRVHVPCDSDLAISAGIQLFGEPKFKTSFSTNLPAMNVPEVDTWEFTCNDPDDPSKAIFTCKADLNGLPIKTADISPQTEYGLSNGELIGCRWNILQPYRSYRLGRADAARVQLIRGDSGHKMRADMEALIGNAPAAAVRSFQSAPAAIQGRAYFI